MIHYDPDRFHPVIQLPKTYPVYDLTRGPTPTQARDQYAIGRYDEKRPGMYQGELFKGARDIHVGIDISAPPGTPVHAFYEGEIHLFGDNSAPGDYGYTLITRHRIDGVDLYALHGHLAKISIEGKRAGQKLEAGDVIARVGDRAENGGWHPHLHFQLSYERPTVCDMPGVVAEKDRAEALKRYPDPRLVLGPLYD